MCDISNLRDDVRTGVKYIETIVTITNIISMVIILFGIYYSMYVGSIGIVVLEALFFNIGINIFLTIQLRYHNEICRLINLVENVKSDQSVEANVVLLSHLIIKYPMYRKHMDGRK